MPTDRSYPIATTVKRIELADELFYPTEVQRNITKHGDFRRMRDGTLRFYERGIYSKWTLSWEGLHESEVARVITIYEINAEFDFTDENSETFAVACLPDSLNTTFSATTISNLTNSIYYDVDLTFEQVYPIASGYGGEV